MPAITDLPCEQLASILRQLDNVRFLTPALLTCRYFYETYKQNLTIKAGILRRQISPALLPYSVAVMELSRPTTRGAIQELLDLLHGEPAKLAARVQTMPSPALSRMGSLHDIIERLAAGFASNAWGLIHPEEPGMIDELVLSPTEAVRFSCAFYRVELFFNSFRSGGYTTAVANARGLEKECFFARYSPWENEQMGCVHSFLEKVGLKATFDILAHDVEFGSYSIDYLTSGNTNGWMQCWISQGLHFVNKLEREDSYDNTKALLKSAFIKDGTYLHTTLISMANDYSNDNTALQDYNEEVLSLLFPSLNDYSMDQGPYQAWKVSNGHFPRSAWVMYGGTAGHRERAYVFWDVERVERYMLLDLFKSLPEDWGRGRGRNRELNAQDFKDMRKSFVERSKIWRRGGSGYWSKGDESRITWRGQVE